DARRRHADYYAALAEKAGPRLRTRDQRLCAAELTAEMDNLRAVLDWAVESETPSHALRLVVPLQVTGLPIGWTATEWADVARRIPGAASHALYPIVVAFAAQRAALLSDLDGATALAADAVESQERLGTQHLWVHMAPAVAAAFSGDRDRALREAE